MDRKRVILFFIVVGVWSFCCCKNTFKESLLKTPKKAELTKNEAIEQKEQVIERQDKDVIDCSRPEGNRSIKYHLQDGLANGHHRIARAGKYDQNNDHLKSTFDFPSLL